MEKITSRENAKVKYACRLASSGAFRRAEGRFLAEGRKLCPELCRGAELETLFCTESALEKCPELSELPGEHYLVEDHVADKLADVGTHQGVFGVFRRTCLRSSYAPVNRCRKRVPPRLGEPPARFVHPVKRAPYKSKFPKENPHAIG